MSSVSTNKPHVRSAPVPTLEAEAVLGPGQPRPSLGARADLAGLRHKRLLVVHGAEDRRVLVHHTLELSRSLVQANIMFQQKVTQLTHHISH